MNEILKLIVNILGTLLFGLFVVSWIWYGMEINIGKKGSGFHIRFWTLSLKRFFIKKNTNQ